MAASADGQKSGRFLGSLKDALVAASREDTGRLEAEAREREAAASQGGAIVPLDEATRIVHRSDAGSPSAAEAAREARTPRTATTAAQDSDSPPTTRVVRASGAKKDDGGSRTALVRGKVQVARGTFDEDPVVGWLVVVGGPGIGQFRPIFEGNNSMGRADSNRIPIDFGDDAISAEEQAYIRYDSSERSFLFVPNLAKTNVVSLNEKRPTSAVELTQMDVITMGRTQLVFVPFCGPDFDWSALQGET
ncbi:FHA domain-containing protein [Hyphomicrobium sp.]|uniref:FHA domain-containing protein n=1 Tax=Hyphomicrobium sp. TaxID=82 RepID=UPI002B624DF8|nr:FHA domain-containing protein [Hyphomicrobium sp.]HRN89103.1 FHA domain-containing protein [Hyphomicrobium sp.]HRQ26885.1 FHA domain-containing protein [Hyphomicrobium sp.]